MNVFEHSPTAYKLKTLETSLKRGRKLFWIGFVGFLLPPPASQQRSLLPLVQNSEMQIKRQRYFGRKTPAPNIYSWPEGIGQA